MRVFCITDFWYPKAGGMERSIDNLCGSMPAGTRMHVLTRQDGAVPCDTSFPYPVVAFCPSETTGYYGDALAHVAASAEPRIVHVFGYSYFWPDAQADFIVSAAQLPGTAVVFKTPTLGDATAYLRTSHAAIVPAVARYVALTEAMARELEECGVQRERISLIPNGVRTDFYAPPSPEERNRARASLGLPGNKMLIGFGGRFERRKRIGTVVEALGRLPASGRPVLVLAGRTDDTFGAGTNIEGFLGPHVRWIGEQKDMRPFYHALDAYVTASEAEGMSNAVLEAMACGLPVVASRIAGHSEMVTPGINGLLFDGGAPDSLADCLAQTHARWARSELDAWRSASRQAAEMHYGQESIARRYEALYQEALA